MTVSIIVACSRNNVIGRDNELPWRLSEDLRHFKQTTMGKPMIMGRKTYDSIGRPLPGRTTLVVTRQRDWRREGVIVCESLPQALAEARRHLAADSDEIIIAGGEEIYRQSLVLADQVYLTRVDLEVDGDAFFPPLDAADWEKVEEIPGVAAADGTGFAFIRYKKR